MSKSLHGRVAHLTPRLPGVDKAYTDKANTESTWLLISLFHWPGKAGRPLTLVNLRVFPLSYVDSAPTAFMISTRLMWGGNAICCSSFTFVSLTPNPLSCSEMSCSALPLRTSASDFQAGPCCQYESEELMQEQGRGTEKSRWNSQCDWPEPEGYDLGLFCQVPLRRDVEIWTSLNPESGRRGYSSNNPWAPFNLKRQ